MNEKNFVGLTVNREFIACGSETNGVFVYHKVKKHPHLTWTSSFFYLEVTPILVFTCRPFRNRWLGMDLVLRMKKTKDLTSSVRSVGRVIAPQCWLQTVEERLKYSCLLNEE